ncbi:Tetratricopeptide TPR_1 repeat-containing protein [Thermodesulfatator indicus DSM 15286]|uniref:Tetratricopeptide TPR_1 repeat-containing protein n=1 Tax=Thermodesulfatator indicus (strain DSM 15286 / JCM 11887 / CIR29812) TaxID=667014 RepID=F8ADJ8_THEID|nr:tetratricopeptide repeat protein [Thermodesulfatator indicus]AEH44872.1 Tetratricopeptide TPR_1 repeat-containing protein [Thermodesulfatator indicus DSM 15286]
MRFKKLLLFVFLLGMAACQSVEPPPSFYQEKSNVHLERAYIYYHEGRLAEALKEAFLAKDINPKDHNIYNLIGLIYMDKGQYNEAEKYFKKALEIAPDSPEILNNLGSLYLLKNEIKKAISCFEKALKDPFYPKPFIAYTNLAWAYYKLGDKDKAIYYLDKALNYNPRYSVAYFYRGLIALEEGILDKAQLDFRRAIRFNRQDMASRYYLGIVYFRLNQIEKAKKVWRSIIELAPESRWALKAEEKLMTLEELEGS